MPFKVMPIIVVMQNSSLKSITMRFIMGTSRRNPPYKKNGMRNIPLFLDNK